MELWKQIKNYDNYSVSNTGLIKNNNTNRILKTYIRNGYYSVSLSNDNKKKTVNIHNIVASHYLTSPSFNNYVVNHINENKLDNNISNLEYLTYSQNTKHSSSSKRTKNEDVFNLEDFVTIPEYSSYMVSKNGDVYSKNIKRLCCHTILPNGYHKIKLKSDANIYKDIYIHVLVAMSYLNYIPSTPYVINHKDGNKGNNNIDNLEVVTHKENMKHSVILNNHKIFRRPVYYIDNNNNKVIYNSAKEASYNTKIDNSSILKSCKSDLQKAGNIKWYYV